MIAAAIADTGPVVALLSSAHRWHDWAKEQFAALQAPLLTCEAVLTEASSDASLVRMSELARDAPVLTLDSDFRIYRRFGRQSIPLITPRGG